MQVQLKFVLMVAMKSSFSMPLVLAFLVSFLFVLLCSFPMSFLLGVCCQSTSTSVSFFSGLFTFGRRDC